MPSHAFLSLILCQEKVPCRRVYCLPSVPRLLLQWFYPAAWIHLRIRSILHELLLGLRIFQPHLKPQSPPTHRLNLGSLLPWLSTTVCYPLGSTDFIVTLVHLGQSSLWICFGVLDLHLSGSGLLLPSGSTIILSYQVCSGLPSPYLHRGHTCLLLHFGPTDLQLLPEYLSPRLLLGLQFSQLNFCHSDSWLLLSSSPPWCFPLPVIVLFRNLIFPASVGHWFPVLLMIIPSVFKPTFTSHHDSVLLMVF